MVRLEVVHHSVRGTWIDGYVRSSEQLKHLAWDCCRPYHSDRVDAVPSLEEYMNDLPKEDYIRIIAVGVRDRFDERFSLDMLPAICTLWPFRTDRQPSDLRMGSPYTEYLVDPRREDYCHLVTIHDECPVAEECLQELMSRLGFEVKPEGAYKELKSFVGAVREILDERVRVVAAALADVSEARGVGKRIDSSVTHSGEQ